jgi:hypothetical protein
MPACVWVDGLHADREGSQVSKAGIVGGRSGRAGLLPERTEILIRKDAKPIAKKL